MNGLDCGMCPCWSNVKYADCCQPLHKGGVPPSAQALMRSRYSGYALGNIEYIMKSEHSDNVRAKLPLDVQREQIKNFCENTQFKGLQILEATENTVMFRAILFQKNVDRSYVEKSYFQKVDGFWKYLRGEIKG